MSELHEIVEGLEELGALASVVADDLRASRPQLTPAEVRDLVNRVRMARSILAEVADGAGQGVDVLEVVEGV